MYKIDVSNVHVGMEIQGYDNLCKTLGINPSTNREQQYKSISKWIDFERTGIRTFLITGIHPVKIFDTDSTIPNKSYDLTISENSKYLEYGRNILIHLLINNGGEIDGTVKTFAERIGLANDSYFIENNEIRLPSSYIAFSYYLDRDMSNIVNNSLISGLGERKGIFKVSPMYYYGLDPHKYGAKKNEPTPYLPASKSVCREAEQIVNKILKKYNIKSYGNLLFQKGDNNKQTRHEISEQFSAQFGWYYYSRGKRLTLNPDISQSELNRFMNIDLSAERKKINTAFIESFKDNMEKRFQKNKGVNLRSMININSDNQFEAEYRRKTIESYIKDCRELDEAIEKYIRI